MRLILFLSLMVGALAPVCALEVEGEFLYLRPSFGDQVYAYVEADDPERICPALVQDGYHPGFAVGLSGECGIWHVGARYMRQEGIDRANLVVGPDEGILSPFTGGSITADRARAKASSNYQSLDVDGAWGISGCGRWSVSGLIGVRWIDVSQFLRADFSGPMVGALRLSKRSAFWGVGPRVGMGLDLCVWRGIRLVGLPPSARYEGGPGSRWLEGWMRDARRRSRLSARLSFQRTSQHRR